MMQHFLECVASNVALSAAWALIVVGLTRVWRAPQLAHALWMLVLLKLVSPPLVAVPIADALVVSDRLPLDAPRENPLERQHQEIGGAAPEAAALSEISMADDEQLVEEPLSTTNVPIRLALAADVGAKPPARKLPRIADQLSLSIPSVVCALWGAGVAVGAVILVRRIRQFRMLLGQAREADETFVAEVGELANRLGLRYVPSIRIVDAHLPPLVCAAWPRPLLLLPQTLLHTLDHEQRQAVLVHELAHLRRGDHLVRWFEIVVCGLLWWNPLAWWAAVQLRRAEEESCDAWVVWTLPHARQSYGRALLHTVDFLLERRAVPAIARTAFGGPHIKRRIEMIVKQNLNRKMSTAALLTVVVSAVCVLPVSAQKRTEPADIGQPAAEERAADETTGELVLETALPEQKPGSTAEIQPKVRPSLQALVAQTHPAETDRNLEARIERLEKMLQEFIQTAKARPAELNGAKPSVAERPTEKATERPQTEAKPRRPDHEAEDNEYIYVTQEIPQIRMVQEKKSIVHRMKKSVAQKNAYAQLKTELLALDQQSWDAAAKHDPSVAERLLADDYLGLYVNASASGSNNKATDIAAVQRRKYTEVTRRDVDVKRIGDNTAILTYVYDCKAHEGDRTETYRDHQHTQVWTRNKEGRWLLRFTQDCIRPGGQ